MHGLPVVVISQGRVCVQNGKVCIDLPNRFSIEILCNHV